MLGLAKRIAGNSSDKDSEVRRWRYVVLRADRGGEPSESNIPQIEKTFGVKVSRPDRRHRRPDLEVQVRENTLAIDALREAVAILVGQVRELGGTVPDVPTGALPPEVEGTQS